MMGLMLFLFTKIFSHLMQVKPSCYFTPQEIEYLTTRIQNGGTEVVEVKRI